MARGRSKAAAYGEAGYAPSRSGGTRTMARPGVAARIAELVAEREATHQASLAVTVVELLALAKAADPTSAGGAKEARLARLEAHRLWQTLERLEAAREAEEGRPVERELTAAEWEARFGYLARR